MFKPLREKIQGVGVFWYGIRGDGKERFGAFVVGWMDGLDGMVLQVTSCIMVYHIFIMWKGGFGFRLLLF